MTTPSYMILYVDKPLESGTFYSAILGQEPVDAAPTFVLFVLPSGLKLGLWSRHTVEPSPGAAGGGGEVGFAVESPDAVDALHADWSARGITILQAPRRMDFGPSFVALDPDGHRLRVFCVMDET